MQGERGDRQITEGGFTLIELAVVVVVIAVLAALAVPVFLHLRSNAHKAHTHTALRDGSTAAESWVTAEGGDYSGMTFEGLTDEGYQDGSEVVLDVANVDATGYCLIVTSRSLPASDEWKVATYDSDEAAPSPEDDCVTGRQAPIAARIIP